VLLVESEKASVILKAGEKNPTYQAMAYSGGKLRVKQFSEPVVYDLSTISGNEVENYLQHDQAMLAGHGKITVHPTHIDAEGALDVDGMAKAEIVGAKKAGKKWEVSIGVLTASDENGTFKTELVPDGERRIINGRTHVGPFYHARGGQINEVSFVDQGGDLDNHVSLAAERKQKEGVPMELALIEFGKSLGIPDPTKLDEAGVVALTAAYEAPPKKKEAEGGNDIVALRAEIAEDVKSLKEERVAFRAEVKRTEDIRVLCASFGHPNVEIEKDGEKRTVSLFDHAVQNGLSNDEVALKAKLWKLEQEDKSGTTQNQYAGYSMTAEANEVLSAAVLLHSNPEKEVGQAFNASIREKVMNEATSGRFRDLGLNDICRMSLQAMGRPFNGFGNGQEFAQHVLSEHRRQALTAAGVSSVSLVNVLENVMNKSLMMSFTRTQSTWAQVAKTYSASDYKQQSFYRLTGKGGFLPIGSGGQVEHAEISDSKLTASVEDFGVMLTLTTKMIVNDDINALSGIGNGLGSMAGRAIDEKLYELLLTWSTSGSNAITEIASTPLSYGALQTIDDHFNDLVDADNKPIDVLWDTLVTGNGINRLASKLSMEESLAGIAQNSSASADVKDNAIGSNEFAGKFKAVHSRWISEKKASGSDPTNTKGKKLTTPANGNQIYFALAGPNCPCDVEPVRVGFLNGQQTPRVSSGSLAFDVEGIGYKALFDFGVDKGDAEGIVRIKSNA